MGKQEEQIRGENKTKTKTLKIKLTLFDFVLLTENANLTTPRLVVLDWKCRKRPRKIKTGGNKMSWETKGATSEEKKEEYIVIDLQSQEATENLGLTEAISLLERELADGNDMDSYLLIKGEVVAFEVKENPSIFITF
uniref:Uncharacterized protein n=1 Tax=viral metagenome TaxID=1070528 RepID=A0A6M3IQ47_9ZZZZ